MKKCTKCLEIKKIECFSPDKRNKDRIVAICKSCMSKATSEYVKKKMNSDPIFRKDRIDRANAWKKTEKGEKSVLKFESSEKRIKYKKEYKRKK